jgi:hypothetical protein
MRALPPLNREANENYITSSLRGRIGLFAKKEDETKMASNDLKYFSLKDTV